jgi:hypothetical protein
MRATIIVLAASIRTVSPGTYFTTPSASPLLGSKKGVPPLFFKPKISTSPYALISHSPPMFSPSRNFSICFTLTRARSFVSQMTRCCFSYSVFATVYCVAVSIPRTFAVMAVGRRANLSFCSDSSSPKLGLRKARITPAPMLGSEEGMLGWMGAFPGV